MKANRKNPDTQETELLLLTDGTVLTNRLTPSMAAILARVDLRPDSATQLTLTRKQELANESEGGLGGPVRVSVTASASTGAERLTEEAR